MRVLARVWANRNPRCAWRGLAGVFTGVLLVGCAAPLAPVAVQPPFSNAVVPQGWTTRKLPSHLPGMDVVALHRAARTQPTRYRVLVLPGSGCTAWMPFADRYFAGLLHAEVVVLHKPLVDVAAAPNAPCSAEFVAVDALPFWRDAAIAAVAALERVSPPAFAQVVVGVSEGAELLPDLVPHLSSVAAVVMLGAPGLDPVVVGAMQAKRTGHAETWDGLQQAQASSWPDATLVQGRTLRYWRAFWHWPLAAPLVAAPWPLLRIWGGADEAVPAQAYAQFSQYATNRKAPLCDVRLPGANHGLQTADRDGVQWLWSQLERWARQPETHICAVVGGEPTGPAPAGLR